MGSLTLSGIIFGHDIERFAHLSAKYLVEIGLMGEKSLILLLRILLKSFLQKS